MMLAMEVRFVRWALVGFGNGAVGLGEDGGFRRVRVGLGWGCMGKFSFGYDLRVRSRAANGGW